MEGDTDKNVDVNDNDCPSKDSQQWSWRDRRRRSSVDSTASSFSSYHTPIGKYPDLVSFIAPQEGLGPLNEPDQHGHETIQNCEAGDEPHLSDGPAFMNEGTSENRNGRGKSVRVRDSLNLRFGRLAISSYNQKLVESETIEEAEESYHSAQEGTLTSTDESFTESPTGIEANLHKDIEVATTNKHVNFDASTPCPAAHPFESSNLNTLASMKVVGCEWDISAIDHSANGRGKSRSAVSCTDITKLVGTSQVPKKSESRLIPRMGLTLLPSDASKSPASVCQSALDLTLFSKVATAGPSVKSSALPLRMKPSLKPAVLSAEGATVKRPPLKADAISKSQQPVRLRALSKGRLQIRPSRRSCSVDGLQKRDRSPSPAHNTKKGSSRSRAKSVSSPATKEKVGHDISHAGLPKKNTIKNKTTPGTKIDELKFKARPVPSTGLQGFVKPPGTGPSKLPTAIKPFSFDQRNQDLLRRKEERIKRSNETLKK